MLSDGTWWVLKAVGRVSDGIGRSQKLTVTASEPARWLEKKEEISREQTERFLHVLP